MSSAVVTGAAGLLGRATALSLASKGVEVHAFVRSKAQAYHDNIVFHEINLAHPIDVRRLPGRIEHVFHLAQAREHRDFPNSAMSIFSTNLASTAHLLDYSHRVGATGFVYASSGGVYDGRVDRILTEESVLKLPAHLGYYLATKFASEALVGSYADFFTVACLRYFFIYGPGQARSMLIPRIYDRVRNGEPLSLQGESGMSLNPVHVSDAAAATIVAAGLTSSATINVAGPETLSLRKISELFGRDLGVPPKFDSADGDVIDLVTSTAKMREMLVPPTISLRESLLDVRE
jgi:UDP-glucose 4-epimerase